MDANVKCRYDEVQEGLIREALVREIRDATRWQSIVEAWQALLAVRRMTGQRRRENATVFGEGCPLTGRETTG